MKTAQDSYTITIKQIVRFQKRMHLEKFQVDKTQNAVYRPLFTLTGFILRNIMKTAQHSYTITMKQIVRLQERMHFEKFQLDRIGHYSPRQASYCGISLKPLKIATPSL